MENINEIIDNLCNKLGTTAEYLIPEYAKMRIAEGITAIVVCAILLAVTGLFLRWVIKKYAATDYHTDAYDLLQIAAIALFGITAIVSAVVAIKVIPQIVRFSVAPYPAFLQDVLRLLGRS